MICCIWLLSICWLLGCLDLIISVGYFLGLLFITDCCGYVNCCFCLIVSIGLWFGSCLRMLVVAGSFAVGCLLIVLLFSIFFICGCIDM